MTDPFIDALRALPDKFRRMAERCIPNGEGVQAFGYCAHEIEVLLDQAKGAQESSIDLRVDVFPCPECGEAIILPHVRCQRCICKQRDAAIERAEKAEALLDQAKGQTEDKYAVQNLIPQVIDWTEENTWMLLNGCAPMKTISLAEARKRYPEKAKEQTETPSADLMRALGYALALVEGRIPHEAPFHAEIIRRFARTLSDHIEALKGVPNRTKGASDE